MLQPNRKIVSSLALALTLPVTLLLQGCPNGRGSVNVDTPDARVGVRFDPRSGAVRVDTPEGSFRGRVDPRGGDFAFDGPGGRVRLSADHYGGSLDARGPGGALRVRTTPHRAQVQVRAHDRRPRARCGVCRVAPCRRTSRCPRVRPHLASLPAVPPKYSPYAPSSMAGTGSRDLERVLAAAGAEGLEPYDRTEEQLAALQVPSYDQAFGFDKPQVTLR